MTTGMEKGMASPVPYPAFLPLDLPEKDLQGPEIESQEKGTGEES